MEETTKEWAEDMGGNSRKSLGHGHVCEGVAK